MAELLINIKAGAYEDGDIIEAKAEDHIHCMHAEHICHVKIAGTNSNGLRAIDSLPDLYKQKTSKYKFERISNTEVKRINLSDLSEKIFSSVAVGKQYMNVPEFIQRRIQHQQHAIFGAISKEYWYGGKRTYDNIGSLWTEIESRTGKLKADHSKWNFDLRTQKKYLIIPATPMTIDEASERTVPLMDSEVESHDQKVVKQRKYKIDWKNIRGVSSGTITKILDHKIPMDFRKFADYDWKIDSVEKT